MKFKLLFFAAFLAFASCSGDDSADPVTEPEVQEPVFKDLKTVNVSYTNVSGRLGNDLLTFENNKLVHYKFGSAGNIYYHYSDSGLLTKQEFYRYDGVLHNRYQIAYDGQGKIIEKFYESFQESDTTTFRDVYTYNNDNTISSKTYFYDSSRVGSEETLAWNRVFYTNASGDITKIVWNRGVNDVLTQEITYNNGNVASLNKQGVESIFTYDMETPVLGQFHNIYKNQLGTNSNIVLYENSFLFEEDLNNRRFTTDNYILSESNDVDNYNYTYEFDDDNYPVTKTLYNNGELYYNIQITYQ